MTRQAPYGELWGCKKTAGNKKPEEVNLRVF
jgi:hypothetical protein